MDLIFAVILPIGGVLCDAPLVHFEKFFGFVFRLRDELRVTVKRPNSGRWLSTPSSEQILMARPHLEVSMTRRLIFLISLLLMLSHVTAAVQQST